MRAEAANWVAESAEGGLVAGDAAEVVGLGPAFAERTVEDAVRVDGLIRTVLLVSLVDIHPKRICDVYKDSDKGYLH